MVWGSYRRNLGPIASPSVRIEAIWRFPVKSMQGELVDSAVCDEHGIEGDRRWAVFDPASGTVLSAKRHGALLEARARTVGAGVAVALPARAESAPGPALDGVLSAWLGRAVQLVEPAGHGAPLFENLSDFERDDSAPTRWTGPGGSFVDSRAIHLLATSDLAGAAAEAPGLDWDVRRFRANLLIDDSDLAATRGGTGLAAVAPGRRLAVGNAVLEIDMACVRCVMTTRAQPGGIERQLDVLRHLHSARSSRLGVLASVVSPGSVRTGDCAAFLD